MAELDRPLDEPLARRASRDARPEPLGASHAESVCFSIPPRDHQLQPWNKSCRLKLMPQPSHIPAIRPSDQSFRHPVFLSQVRTGVL